MFTSPARFNSNPLDPLGVPVPIVIPEKLMFPIFALVKLPIAVIPGAVVPSIKSTPLD